VEIGGCTRNQLIDCELTIYLAYDDSRSTPSNPLRQTYIQMLKNHFREGGGVWFFGTKYILRVRQFNSTLDRFTTLGERIRRRQLRLGIEQQENLIAKIVSLSDEILLVPTTQNV
jgi:hypothetical protein